MCEREHERLRRERLEILERIWKIKKEINKLTGIADTKDECDLLGKAYDLLDELLSPICPNCNVRAKRFITSPAQLYDSAMAELPGGTRTYWTGEWYCPQCNRIVASGEKWWETTT